MLKLLPQPSTPREATNIVRRNIDEGADIIKLFTGSNVSPARVLPMSDDVAVAGGQILFGTDVGYLTDSDPSREYELMGRAGLTWREILASLTTNPAARFREASRRGRVAPGLAADLVVLRRDPPGDVRALADVRSTIRAGRVCY